MFQFNKIVPLRNISNSVSDSDDFDEYENYRKRIEEEEFDLFVSAILKEEKKQFHFDNEVRLSSLYHYVKFSFNISEEIKMFARVGNKKAEIDEKNWEVLRKSGKLIIYVQIEKSDFEIVERVDTGLLLSFPSKIYYKTGELKRLIESDFQLYGVANQFKRDVQYWGECLQNCTNNKRLGILRRILTVVKFGGLLYRNSKNYWKPYPYPICTALSHGSRILIQLPRFELQNVKSLKIPTTQYRNGFWNWLLTGDPTKSGNSEVVSVNYDSKECRKEGCVVFKRISATHTIKEMEKPVSLSFGRQLVVCEEKSYAINMRDTKTNYISSDDYIYSHHKHWALNVAMGGEGNPTLTGKKILSNGSFGSLYLYHRAPKPLRYGGLMIGLENCEYGCASKFGEKHSIKGTSAKFTPTNGFKWSKLKSIAEAPEKINGMLIDLSLTGWDFLIEKEWDDTMVESKIEPIKRVIRKKTKMVEVDDFVVLIDDDQ